MNDKTGTSIKTYKEYLSKYYPKRSDIEKHSGERAKDTAARMAKETLKSVAKHLAVTSA